MNNIDLSEAFVVFSVLFSIGVIIALVIFIITKIIASFTKNLYDVQRPARIPLDTQRSPFSSIPHYTNAGVKKSDFPYKLNNCLLTKDELRLYNTLLPLAERHKLTINIKLRLADFIDVTYENSSKQKKYYDRISVKHIDFLLCYENAEPAMGFEYDSTADMPERITAHDFKRSLFYSIGLDVHYVFMYTAETLETHILDSLRRRPTGGDKNWPRPFFPNGHDYR